MLLTCGKKKAESTEAPPSPAPEETPVATVSDYLYVSNKNGNSISVLKIDLTDGEPVFTPVETFDLPEASASPGEVQVGHTGAYLYVGYESLPGLKRLAISPSTGTLTSDRLNTTTSNVLSFAVVSEDLFAVTSQSMSLKGYAIDTDGSFYFTGNGSSGGLRLVRHPSLRLVYYLGSSNIIAAEYDIMGTMTDLENHATAGNDVKSFAVDPKGKIAVAVHHFPGLIQTFTLDAAGRMTDAASGDSNGDSGSYPVAVAMHPSLNVFYIAHTGSYAQPFISVSTFNATSGAYSQIATLPLSAAPSSIVIDPSGKHLTVVANAATGKLLVYKIDESTGLLTAAANPTYDVGLNAAYGAIARVSVP